MSNSLDPDQVGHFVGPDLGPNCLQKLSTLIGKKLNNAKTMVSVYKVITYT